MYKIKKKGLKRKIDDIRLVRNPLKLLRNLTTNILRLETLIRKKNKKNRYC